MGRLLYEHVDSMSMEECTKQALKNAKEHGCKIAIVTNGTKTQQTLEIQKVGLEPYVDAVVISEAERVKKPDPKIFQIAAQRLISELTDGSLDDAGHRVLRVVLEHDGHPPR